MMMPQKVGVSTEYGHHLIRLMFVLSAQFQEDTDVTYPRFSLQRANVTLRHAPVRVHHAPVRVHHAPIRVHHAHKR